MKKSRTGPKRGVKPTAVALLPIGVAASVVLAACGGSSTTKADGSKIDGKTISKVMSGGMGKKGGKPPSGGKPSGAPGGATAGGAAGGPGGGGGSSPVLGTGAYTVSGTTASKSGATVTAAKKNESGVLVKKDGTLTLADVVVKTTGASSSSDDSSFYGLDSGVLVFEKGTITETGGSVRTTGAGANAVFAYGSDAVIKISKTHVTATGQYSHGIMASGGGTITATGLVVSTKGASSASVATDRGGGTITVIGGSYKTAGHNSPGLYSTGTLIARDATFLAMGAEAAVVEGSNSVTAVDSSLTGSVNRGVMIYQSFSGDASGQAGLFKETGGSLTAKSGPLFFVTNTSGTVKLHDVKLKTASGVLIEAAASDWGTTGSNGGNVTLDATDQKLAGSVVVDKISTAVLDLASGSKLTSTVNGADTAKNVTIDLDSTSSWVVTGTSYVTTLSGLEISGSEVTNIVGDGHTVYYDSSVDTALDGKTYTLAGGGYLKPGS